MLIGFLKCLRPKQWTKNLLLFAGILFAREWSDVPLLINAISAFVVFCMLSGVVYICNDILDVEQDRLHPKKKNRPIAAGKISPMAAGIGGFLLLASALTYSFLFLPIYFAYLAVGYFLLVTAYSFKFKHMVVLDILVLAMGFVIRALAGLEAINVDPENPIPITSYFLLTTLFLALFLAAAKRRSELVTLGDGGQKTTRKVLKEYSKEYLDLLLAVAATGTLFSYALWTTQGQFARNPDGTTNVYLLVLTIPYVMYGMFRYLWMALRRGEGGAPETLLIEDIPLLVTVVLWMGTVVAVLARMS